MLEFERYKLKTKWSLSKGRILISEPTLPDENFRRSVVYLCMHDADGSLGFVINKKLSEPLSFFFDDIQNDQHHVYLGGPVANDSLHFIHTRHKDLGGQLIDKQIAYLGDFDKAIQLIQENKLQTREIKFFIGYSGWETNQLQVEIDQKSWLVSNIKKEELFATTDKELWRNSILNLDTDFHPLLEMPADPSWN